MNSLFMNRSRLVFRVPIHSSRRLFLFPTFSLGSLSSHFRQCDSRCAIITYLQLGEIYGVWTLQLNVISFEQAGNLELANGAPIRRQLKPYALYGGRIPCEVFTFTGSIEGIAYLIRSLRDQTKH